MNTDEIYEKVVKNGFLVNKAGLNEALRLQAEQIHKIIQEHKIYAMRLTQFGAEYDQKMRSELRNRSKQEPTCLVQVYLDNLQDEIKKRCGE